MKICIKKQYVSEYIYIYKIKTYIKLKTYIYISKYILYYDYIIIL